MLVEDLEKARQRQQLLEWETNERKLAGSLPPAAKTELSSDWRDRLAVFVNYCKSNNVRHCPARPSTCGAFAAAEAADGRDAQGILALLAAIEELHDYHDLSNPVATATVSAVLNRIIEPKPPRSWTKEEQVAWSLLPPLVQATITRREKDRDRDLRRRQGELLELRKRLTDGAETNTVQTNINEEIHYG